MTIRTDAQKDSPIALCNILLPLLSAQFDQFARVVIG